MTIVLVLLFGVVTATLALWLGRTDGGILRQQLTEWQFWVLEIQFVSLVGLTWLNAPSLLRTVAASRTQLARVGAASLLAAVLAGGVAPHTTRIYYDEHIYQGVGQNLSDLHLAQICNEGTVEYGRLQCRRGEYNKQPYGYPYLLSVAYRLVGVNDGVAHVMNILSAALLVWVVFLTGTLLFRSVTAGSFGALIMALIPQQLLWSHTAASEPSAALMHAAAFLAAVYFIRSRTRLGLVWMVVAVAFVLQFRLETALIVPVVAGVVVLYAPQELRRSSFWWAVLLGLVLCAVYVGHFYAVRTEGWGTSGARLSLEYFWPNLRTNGWFYIWDARFPTVYSALALFGLAMHRTRATAVCLGYFGLFCRRVPVLLRGELQLRGRRAIFTHDLSGSCSPRRMRSVPLAADTGKKIGSRHGMRGRPSRSRCVSSSSGISRWCGRSARKPGQLAQM